MDRAQFTAQELAAVVDEAHASGLPVTAHAHALVAIRAAVAAGVDGIEHFTFLTAEGVHMAEDVLAAVAAQGIVVCPTLGRVPGAVPPPGLRERMRKAGLDVDARAEQVVARRPRLKRPGTADPCRGGRRSRPHAFGVAGAACLRDDLSRQTASPGPEARGRGGMVLHLRLICPPDRTDEARALLDESVGVAHIVEFRGAAVRPAGDMVEADVARECVDELLTDLTALSLDHDGAITLEALETVLSDAADAAEEAAPGQGADAVVWDELVSRTGEDSRLTAGYQTFLTIACLLAAIGAITDSPVTVVGAMVLGPEFGPLAAVAVGLVLRRRDLVARGATALAVGFPLAMAITAGVAIVFDVTGLLTTGALDRLDDVEFIYQVGPFSFIIAVLAGVAGMLAITSAKSASLIGVFISVTTVPAAAFASVALVERRLTWRCPRSSSWS